MASADKHEAGEERRQGEDEEETAGPPRMQHLFVMRHGERLDDADRNWVTTAPRPWDPPLTELGKWKARDVGRRLRREGWNITRVLCSPFLRCVQTAAEVIIGLCAIEPAPDGAHGRDVPIDPSKVKLPTWPETLEAADQRYLETFQAAADMFPTENVLCVTHGEGVAVSVSHFRSVAVYQVRYCAVSHAQRSVYTFTSPPEAGQFELITEPGEESGISFYEQ